MRELFKIGPQRSQDQPVPFHPYHLQSHNCTHGITPSIIYPLASNIDRHHSSLLCDLSEGIWNTLSILEGSDTSGPFPSLLYSTTNTMCEPHANPTPTRSTTEITLLPSDQSSTPSTLLPLPTLPIFLTIYPIIIYQITTMSQPVIPLMPMHGDCGSP